jgi:outer membrane murein-binding lipoprotein Lpp
MTKFKKAVSLVALLAFLLGTMALTGCTKYANEDQLKVLDETKAAALAAEKKVQDLQAEKSTLERERDAKKAELEKVKREKAAVKSRLDRM